MNITEQIESLFKNGVRSLTIAKSPKDTLYVQAGQVVQTGPGADHMQITHQVDDADLPGLLNTLRIHVEHANEIKSHVVSLPRNGK